MTANDPAAIRLTQYSHGAGCGCKIAPDVLGEILAGSGDAGAFADLLVGHESRDDAAVFRLSDDIAVVSTTDFFMPIVDDAYDFGRIAATNAISDVYAMGGEPIMAIAILGWPIAALPPSEAAKVIAGGRAACSAIGVPLAGGHSIDAPEPIFGLSVTGRIHPDRVKRNDRGRVGDTLFLGKPLGIGILTTAEKRGVLRDEHRGVAAEWMCRPNRVGLALADLEEVHAVTDVTGFGLLGHLAEMCQGSHLAAQVVSSAVPLLPGVEDYAAAGQVPGGTERNLRSLAGELGPMERAWAQLLADPQTSGGLLIAADPGVTHRLEGLGREHGTPLRPIGTLVPHQPGQPRITIRR